MTHSHTHRCFCCLQLGTCGASYLHWVFLFLSGVAWWCNKLWSGWISKARWSSAVLFRFLTMPLWVDMAMDQYLLIPFLGGWTSIYQLFWCELQGYKVLTHCHMSCLKLMNTRIIGCVSTLVGFILIFDGRWPFRMASSGHRTWRTWDVVLIGWRREPRNALGSICSDHSWWYIMTYIYIYIYIIMYTCML